MISLSLTERKAGALVAFVPALPWCQGILSLAPRCVLPVARGLFFNRRGGLFAPPVKTRLRGVRGNIDRAQFPHHAFCPCVQGLRGGPLHLRPFIGATPSSIAGTEESTDGNRKIRTT
jgi:hypothetical protein